MQKINFTNTTITKKPYVVINGVEYEVQDGTYTGGTDLDANTFNTMQDNIEKAINSLYPIGTIIIRDEDLDMSSWLGFTWEKVFAGKVLVGVESTDDDFNTIGNTGGEKNHTLTIEEMPSHNHNMKDNIYGGYVNALGIKADGGGGTRKLPSFAQTDTNSLYIPDYTGGSKSHNNMPPYQVVAYWKRIA